MNEMGSRYLFIVLYVWLEHHLSRGDYRRDGDPLQGPWNLAGGPAPAEIVADAPPPRQR